MFITVMSFLSTLCVAQAKKDMGEPPHGQGHGSRPMRIEDMIPDLSNTQKTRLEIITQRSSKMIDKCRAQLDELRDSIRLFMDDTIDRSEVLYPMFEREGRLQAQMSKYYYMTKRDMDAVLTPKQYKQLREKMAASKPPRRNDKPHHRK